MFERFQAIYKSTLLWLVLIALSMSGNAQQTRVTLWTEPDAAEVYLITSSSKGKGLYLGLSDKPLIFPPELLKARGSLDLRIEKPGFHSVSYNIKVLALTNGAKLPTGEPIRLPAKSSETDSLLGAVGAVLALGVLVAVMAPKFRLASLADDSSLASVITSLDSDPLIGQNVCGFRFKKQIAKGGMGSVYLAESSDTKAAVKVIDLFGQPEAMKDRYFRELAIASQLHHPSLVRTWDYSMIGDRYLAIVMEWLPGKPIDSVLTGPVAPGKALEILKPVFDGLQFLHDRNIVHRDIKPGNILLLDDGSTKIIDFGLAKHQAQHALTRTGNVMGTPNYMAPEQIRGKKEVGHQADQYALGLVLLEMVTGQKAFPPQDAMSMLFLRLQTDPPLAHDLCPQVSPNFSNQLARMTRKYSHERFATVAEAFDHLRQTI